MFDGDRTTSAVNNAVHRVWRTPSFRILLSTFAESLTESGRIRGQHGWVIDRPATHTFSLFSPMKDPFYEFFLSFQGVGIMFLICITFQFDAGSVYL